MAEYDRVYLRTKFPGLFQSYKLKFWEIDSVSNLLLCSNSPEDLKKKKYNIRHLQIEEGTYPLQFVINVEVEREIFLEADTQLIKSFWMKKITALKQKVRDNYKTNTSNLEVSKNTAWSAAGKQIEMTAVNRPDRSLHKKKSKGQNYSAKVAKETLPVSMEQLDSIGLSQFVKHLDSTFVNYNVLSGTHRVKKREIFSYFKQKYLVLFSSKSLYPEKHTTDVMLMESQLPPWFDINTLYQFDITNGKRKAMFKSKDIIQVSGLSYQSTFHTIKINTGNRIHTLGFSQFAMAKKWKEQLELANKNAHEVEQNGVKIKKNIDPLLIQLTQKRLLQRLITFYETNRPTQYVVPKLIQFLHKVKLELESVCEAALAKQPPEPQLINFYFDYFHDKVFVQIKLTWDNGFQTMPPIYTVQLMKWLQQYCLSFQEYVSDIRMQQAINTLAKITGRRISKQLRALVVSIAQSDKQDNLFQQDGELFTNSVIDIFKFVNDSINIYYTQGISDNLMWVFIILAHVSFKTYINTLRQTIDDNTLSQNQLIAITNNSGLFLSLMGEFVEDRAVTSRMDEYAVKIYLESQQLCRSMFDLSAVTRDKLALSIVDKITKYYRGRKYLIVNIENLLRIIFETDISTQKLNAKSKIAFWKAILRALTNQVIRCIAHSYQKGRKGLLKDTTEKMYLDLEVISNEFQQLIGSANLRAEKDKLCKTLVVLEATEGEAILKALCCQEFKQHPYIKKLIQYRTDLPSSLQKSLQKELEQMPIESDSLRNSAARKSMKHRKKTMMLCDMNQRSRSILEVEEGVSEEEYDEDQDEEASTADIQVTISQGYLYKKKDKNKMWEKRYFRLKKGCLYWFASEDSSISQNQLVLSEVKDVVVKSPDKTTFTLMAKKQGKFSEYKIKCNSVEQRQLWVRSILAEIKTTNSAKQKAFTKLLKFQEKSTLIIDYDLIYNPELQQDSFSDQKRNLHQATILLNRPKQTNPNSRKASEYDLQQSRKEAPPQGLLACFYTVFG